MTSVWLDCDPGHDDAFAILLCDHPKLKLLGISTVHGNQTVEKTTTNAINTLAWGAMKNIPVVKGLSKPLVLPLHVCPEIHGVSGLDGAKFPETDQKPIENNAIVEIYNTLKHHESKVTIIITGCATNIAALLTVFPDIKKKIELVFFFFLLF